MRREPLQQDAAATPPPVHVAIIMDGNRRWARSRGMPPTYGHRRGAKAVRRAVEACAKAGLLTPEAALAEAGLDPDFLGRRPDHVLG